MAYTELLTTEGGLIDPGTVSDEVLAAQYAASETLWDSQSEPLRTKLINYRTYARVFTIAARSGINSFSLGPFSVSKGGNGYAGQAAFWLNKYLALLEDNSLDDDEMTALLGGTLPAAKSSQTTMAEPTL